MTRWYFKGASGANRSNPGRFVGTDYLAGAGGGGAAAAGGAGEGAGAGAALPAVVGAEGAGVAAAAACGCAAGLIQQAWTRLSRVEATFGSIWAPNRVRQRNVA